MKVSIPGILIAAVLIAGAAIILSRFLGSPGEGRMVEVNVPTLSSFAARGKVAFDANCAECHGTNGAGNENGPPLVHDIYNPGHHADVSFVAAAKRGVAQHHWQFGDMPPQPEVSDTELAEIIRYVRELQRSNGIVYRPHRM